MPRLYESHAPVLIAHPMAELNVYRDWLEVPGQDLPPEGPPDHYALLRVPKFEDNPEKVRSSYRGLNNKVRAYASGKYSVQSQELLNELAKAMLCLTDEDRKRDYDRSLGREVEEETNRLGRVPMGQLLVKAKKIGRDQLREAEGFAEARGLELRDAVVQMKLVPAKLAYRAYAREQGYSYADLGEMNPTEEVLAQFPKATAKRHSIVPLVRDDDAVMVARRRPAGAGHGGGIAAPLRRAAPRGDRRPGRHQPGDQPLLRADLRRRRRRRARRVRRGEAGEGRPRAVRVAVRG